MRDAVKPLSDEDYDFIYSRVPRLTVEVLLRDENGAVFLTRRAIAPCRGLWHIPGGTVRYGEPLLESVRRIGQRELGIVIKDARDTGHIEYPSHYLHGLGCPVGIVFEITKYSGEIRPGPEADDGQWFEKRLPSNMHADQDSYLVGHGFLPSDGLT